MSTPKNGKKLAKIVEKGIHIKASILVCLQITLLTFQYKNLSEANRGERIVKKAKKRPNKETCG